MADISNISYSQLSDLRATIYDMLALDSTGTSSTWLNPPLGIIDVAKYWHLTGGISAPPSVQSRKKVADLFYRYLTEGY